jgi:hypothetical protein
MAKSGSVMIAIAGRIRRADILKLAQAIEDDFAGVDWDDCLNTDGAVEEISRGAAAGEPPERQQRAVGQVRQRQARLPPARAVRYGRNGRNHG